MASDITDPTLVHGDSPEVGATSGGDTGDGDAPTRQSHWLRETLVIVIVAVGLAILLHQFVVQTFYIPSGSMEPTLQIGDRIVVSKLSYDLHAVHQGDIVVFDRPAGEATSCGGPEVNDLVKRVIGLPGQTISLSHGHVFINGRQLDETWLPASEQGMTYPAGPSGTGYDLKRPYVIPANHYFMMGDNRADSCDSRYWGPIDRNLIVGKVDLRVWPLTSFAFF